MLVMKRFLIFCDIIMSQNIIISSRGGQLRFINFIKMNTMIELRQKDLLFNEFSCL